MKKTKKVLAVLMAAAMAVSTSALAANAATITPPTTGNGTGSTQVQYNTADDSALSNRPAYTVEIPETVALAIDTEIDRNVKIYGASESDNVFIPYGQTVKVSITNSANGASALKVKNGTETGAPTLDYQLKSASGDYTSDVSSKVQVASCAAASKSLTNKVTFKLNATADQVEYAGSYSDTLTFTVNVS